MFFRKKYNAHRLLLYASKLSIIHPVSKENLVFEAGLDEMFIHIIKECGFEY